jgi:YspA, cpYpsA-related SLOG family
MSGHRALVAGGRDYFHRERQFEILDYYRDQIDCIIQGCAPGADQGARAWAILRAVPFLDFPAAWELYGSRAGPMRNRQMIVEGLPTLGIIFPGGRGTANMVEQLEHCKIPFVRVS